MPLNQQQHTIVASPIGKHLIIAGAGTGKTTTLLHRVAWLLEHHQSSGNILLITFTKRAAMEMSHRLEQLIGKEMASRVTSGTIHGWCARTLRKYASWCMTSPSFSIADETDAHDVMSDVLADLGLKRRDSPLPKASRCLALWSASRNKEIPIERIIEKYQPDIMDFIDTFLKICQAYEQAKQDAQVLDYDDVILRMRASLQVRPDLAEMIGTQFPHVIIDEYQDVNKAQSDIGDLLTHAHGSLMVVGDDAQSIYGFRGAEVEHIRSFTNRHQQARVSYLTENYRSHNGILRLANKSLTCMSDAFKKELTSDRDGDKPLYVQPKSENDQADIVVHKIESLLHQGVQANNIAILARNGRSSMLIESLFARKRLKYVKYGGVRMDEMAHIKDIMSLFKIAINPADRRAWMRFVSLLDGIGRATALAIADEAVQGKVWTRTPKARKNFDALDELSSIINAIRSSRPQDAACIAIAYYKPFLDMNYDDCLVRWHDMAIVHDMMVGFTTINEALDSFIVDRPDADRNPSAEKIVISTIHSAKGLEWEHVFIINACEGILPSSRSSDEEDMEEERRLWYVAITRAKHGLTISSPLSIRNYDGSMLPSSPSRFINEVHDLLLHKPQQRGIYG